MVFICVLLGTNARKRLTSKIDKICLVVAVCANLYFSRQKHKKPGHLIFRWMRHCIKPIKSIKYYYFFVNTKYISSSELKTSEFSFELFTCENSDLFNTVD